MNLLGERLSPEFFARDPVVVARAMLGTYLVHEFSRGEPLVGRIVETEAYGRNDPACHGFANEKRQANGLAVQGRSALLFGPPGVAYVYLNYGVHWLFNVVAGKPGEPGAVLVRAVEPVFGVERMRHLRAKARRLQDLTNGPGKLTAALDIDARFNGCDLAKGPLYITRPVRPIKERIAISERIGITKGVELPWRFFFVNNPFVSPAKISS